MTGKVRTPFEVGDVLQGIWEGAFAIYKGSDPYDESVMRVERMDGHIVTWMKDSAVLYAKKVGASNA